MKDTKTKFRLFTLFEYEEEQAFLEQEHREGWKVTGFKLPGFYKFEKCQPQEMYYRIDFTDEKGSKNPQYLQMFADNGWDFLWSVNGYSIFRKAAENAGQGKSEIFTDTESQINMLKKIQQKRLLPLITIFLCAVVPNFVKGVNGQFGPGLLENILTGFFAVMFVFYIYVFVKSFVKIGSLKKKLQ